MVENVDSTCILKSLKDLDKFMSQNSKPRNSMTGQNFSYLSPHDGSPKLKLNFSESFNNTSFSEGLDSSNETYLQRQRQNMAGFDITKKIREKDSEIIDRKATITILESRIETLQSSHKKRKLEYESEADSYKSKLLQDQELIDDLQHKIKQLKSRENELKEELFEIKANSENKCSYLENKMLVIHTDYQEKTNQYREELADIKMRSAKLERNFQEKASMLILLETTNKELDERCKYLQDKLMAAEKTLLDMSNLKTQYSHLQIKNKELKMHLEELQNMESKYELFERSIQRVPMLEKEVSKLKEENNTHRLIGLNVGLLEEKLNAAENLIHRLETRNSELTAENGTFSTLREMSEKVEAAIMKEFELEYMPSAIELAELLQSLKKSDVESSNTLTELRESLKSHDNTRINNDVLVKTLQKELEEKCQEVEKRDMIIRRLQRKIVLVSKERDNLKGIISSYESESTISPSLLDQEKIMNLEAIVKDHKTEISKLEDELDLLQKSGRSDIQFHSGNQTNFITTKQDEKISEMQKLVAALTEEKEVLEMRLDQQILKGSYDLSKTKVLHFLDNPLEKANQESKMEYGRLQKENEVLKLRVKLLEEGENMDLTQKVGAKVGSEVNNKKLQELEEENKTLEIRNNRLLEVFKQKSQQMREVVFRLTGYRVDLRGDKHYKLLNAYSDSQEDYLLFEETANGVLSLLENDFSASLHDLIKAYLRGNNDELKYPPFLAAVTLDLYNRQTMITSPHSSSNEEEGEFEGAEEGDEEEEEEDDYEGGEEEVEEEYEGGEDYDEEDENDGEEEGQQSQQFNRQNNEDDDDLICID